VDRVPTLPEIRDVLAAASDVVFSDGVSEAFLDQWAAETVFVLSARHEAEGRAGARVGASSGRRGR
jgi:hypothetical protein